MATANGHLRSIGTIKREKPLVGLASKEAVLEVHRKPFRAAQSGQRTGGVAGFMSPVWAIFSRLAPAECVLAGEPANADVGAD